MVRIKQFNVTPLRILSVGFAGVILAGGILLTLPIASRSGQGISFLDALFTAASSACVTGLAVFDTYLQFSLFGQVVMLCLIQVGGLGFMAIALLFSMAIKKRIGLRERSVMMESIGALKLGGIIRLVRRVLLGTLIIELAGACLLATRFIPKFGLQTGLWYSVFHSVSAFCNAGFDLMGKISPSSSLIPFADDIVVNVAIMLLIILGGIGFIVWDDIIDNKWHIKRFRLQTKIVLSTTITLIVLGAAGFYIFEGNHAFAGMPTGEKILASFFQSVTPRTAGFCTVDMRSLSDSGSVLTLLLMLIGASPGSTGGGIKTTTFFVMMFSMLAYARKQDSINVFNRKVEYKAVERAYNSATLYMVTLTIGVFILLQQGVALGDAAFEVFSAIGTVGLSKGLTPNLTAISKGVIIFLMYVGRVGSLSVAMAVSERRFKTKIDNVTEKIITG